MGTDITYESSWHLVDGSGNSIVGLSENENWANSQEELEELEALARDRGVRDYRVQEIRERVR
jgi:hypothetical protein